MFLSLLKLFDFVCTAYVFSTMFAWFIQILIVDRQLVFTFVGINVTPLTSCHALEPLLTVCLCGLTVSRCLCTNTSYQQQKAAPTTAAKIVMKPKTIPNVTPAA